MKLYSIEGKQRLLVGVGLICFAHAVLYYLVAYFPQIGQLLDLKIGIFGFFELLDMGAFVGIFWLVYQIFDSYLWRIPFIRKPLCVPDLNGDWIGTMDREDVSEKLQEDKLPIHVKITQTYFRMQFCLENMNKSSLSGATKSDAIVMGIEGTEDSGYMLNLLYEMETQPSWGGNRLRLTSSAEGDFLQGKYVSLSKRVGTMDVKRIPKNYKFHKGSVKRLTNRSGLPYLGVPIAASLIAPAERKLSKWLDSAKLKIARQNRKARDGLGYHITVVTPDEMDTLDENLLAAIENAPEVGFVIEQIGTIERNDAKTYFITVHSPHCAYMRMELGLKPKDFHITLGFEPHDIHDCPKDHSTWIRK